MISERWRRIEQIYEAALLRPAEERAAFLASTCQGDDTLRRDVERLIAANDHAGEFLDSPAWALAPEGLNPPAMADDRAASLVGRQVGHYSILAPLGRGGMGDVYRAHDSDLHGARVQQTGRFAVGIVRK